VTPDALRAAIASARLRPRMYGADARDLSGYLHGLVAGAHDGSASVAAQWQSAWDATIGSGDAPLADAEVCDVALRVVAALWPQGDDCAAYSTAPLDTPMAPAVVAAMRSAPAARVVVPDALDLDAIEARERAALAALAAAREALRGGYDLAGFDRLALEERRADDALRLVAALRAERASHAPAAQPAPLDFHGALAAVRNGRFVATCSQCSAEWPLDRRDCPGCGHPDRAAGAVPAGFDDLFADAPVEDDDDAAQLAALAGARFAEQHPDAAAGVLGNTSVSRRAAEST
jgi:hypothetical protein